MNDHEIAREARRRVHEARRIKKATSGPALFQLMANASRETEAYRKTIDTIDTLTERETLKRMEAEEVQREINERRRDG